MDDVKGLCERAAEAVERLANTQMNLSLAEWGDISNAILSALQSLAKELAEARARQAGGFAEWWATRDQSRHEWWSTQEWAEAAWNAAFASQRDLKEAQGYAQLAAAGWEQEKARALAAEAASASKDERIRELREALRDLDEAVQAALASLPSGVQIPLLDASRLAEARRDARALTKETADVGE